MKLPLLIALFFVWLEEFAVWHSLVSHIAETELPWQELQADSDHLIAVSYLSETGPAELHESQREILVVQGGEGTLLVGAAIFEPETVKAYEARGSSIAGSNETQLRAETLSDSAQCATSAEDREGETT
ncbi:MAG: hypothetical protein JOZ14_13585 [Acidobacteria bacterium]|nr:hypothetical protein [Acidobacteriota bacterium]